MNNENSEKVDYPIEESKKARKQESKKARKQESKKARKQESKKARKQESCTPCPVEVRRTSLESYLTIRCIMEKL